MLLYLLRLWYALTGTCKLYSPKEGERERNCQICEVPPGTGNENRYPDCCTLLMNGQTCGLPAKWYGWRNPHFPLLPSWVKWRIRVRYLLRTAARAKHCWKHR